MTKIAWRLARQASVTIYGISFVISGKDQTEGGGCVETRMRYVVDQKVPFARASTFLRLSDFIINTCCDVLRSFVNSPLEWKHRVTKRIVQYLKVSIPCGIHNLPRAGLISFFFAACLTLSFPQVSQAIQVTLAWDPNNEPDLAGYIAYWGTSSRDYPYLTDVGNNTVHTITGLEDGRVYYFAITAYDSDYNESAYSAELVYPNNSNNFDSSGDGDGGGGGCFIATAAFGSPVAESVAILRQFRDQILLPNRLGRTAVVFYYKHSPPYADYIAVHDNLRRLVRWSLLPIVGLCWVILKLGLWQALAVYVLLHCFIVSIPIVIRITRKNKSIIKQRWEA